MSRYHFLGEDDGYIVCVDNQNNVYVTGKSWNGYSYDVTTIKYLQDGSTSWIKYAGSGNRDDIPSGMVVDHENNIIVAVNTNIGVNQTWLIVKYNSNGTLIWSKTFNNKYLAALTIDPSDNIYVTGSGEADTFTYISLVKFDKYGDVLWSRSYADSIYDNSYHETLEMSSSGEIIVAAVCGTSIAGADIILQKFSPEGNRLWYKRTIPGYNYEDVCDICVDDVANIYISGSYSDLATNYPDYYILKFSSEGTLIWSNTYPMPNYSDEAVSIVNDEHRNIYVTGQCGNKLTTIKYDSLGSIDWIRTSEPPFGAGKQIQKDSSGNMYVSGWVALNQFFVGDYITLKYSPDGILLWQITYNGPTNGDDKVNSFCMGSDNSIYVTGQSRGNYTDFDYCTIKYSQVIGISQITGNLPDCFSLHQNYPNPFNPTTKIKFDIPLSRGVDAEGRRGVLVKLIVYDLLGREVATLVHEQLKPGTYEVEWNGPAFASGVYFYSLVTEEFSQTRKLILLK